MLQAYQKLQLYYGNNWLKLFWLNYGIQDERICPFVFKFSRFLRNYFYMQTLLKRDKYHFLAANKEIESPPYYFYFFQYMILLHFYFLNHHDFTFREEKCCENSDVTSDYIPMKNNFIL